MAYLPHARMVEPQHQPFLSKAPTDNDTAGLCNPFLGYSPLNTLPRRCMMSHPTVLFGSHVTWLLCDILNATIELGFLCVRSVRRLYNVTLLIFGSQFQMRRVE
jgi:hypothetical protein